MGAVKRDRERERGKESRYVLWVSNDRERGKKIKSSTRERNVEGEVLRQDEKKNPGREEV